MDYFAGLDVSVKETSVCIVDDTGKIVRETRVASEPEALLQVLTNTIYRFKRVGLEAGPLSQWLYSVLAEAGLPVICVETRHMRAVLKAQINKTDRNDARSSKCHNASSPRMPKPPHPLSAMSYCHMSLNWCSETIANAVGGKCTSYVGGDLCLCLLIQAGNCCCDRGC